MTTPPENASTAQFDLFVIGGANIDYTSRGPDLPTADQPVQGSQFLEAPGGKGANQAVEAARLGARVTFQGCIGADQRGDWILSTLAQEGVDTRYLVRDPQTPTGVVVLQVNEKGQKQTMAVPGANRKLEIAHLPAQAIASARVLLIQLEVPLPLVEGAVRIAHEAGVKVVLDPAPAIPLPDSLLRQVDILKPDAGEARVLTGITVTGRATARQAADQLLRRGAKAVAIQAGHEGNLLIWPGGESWNPLLPVKTVDTTGAGDAFSAALGVSLAEGRPLQEAGPFANAAAALATTALGSLSSLPYRAEVEKILRDSGAYQSIG